jgi:hypothetical protein
MNRDDIIRMAREAGLRPIDEFAGAWITYDEPIERFAKLIRNDYSTKHAQLWLKRIDEAVAAEREACAKVCEEPGWNAANWCATQIRARGQA